MRKELLKQLLSVIVLICLISACNKKEEGEVINLPDGEQLVDITMGNTIYTLTKKADKTHYPERYFLRSQDLFSGKNYTIIENNTNYEEITFIPLNSTNGDRTRNAKIRFTAGSGTSSNIIQQGNRNTQNIEYK